MTVSEQEVQDHLNIYEEARQGWFRSTNAAAECRAVISRNEREIKSLAINAMLDPSIDGSSKEKRDAQALRLVEADPRHALLAQEIRLYEKDRQAHEAIVEDAVHAMRGARLAIEWAIALVQREAAMLSSKEMDRAR